MKQGINGIWIMIVAVMLFSCGKQANKPEPLPANAGKLAKVSLGGGYSDSFYYRQDGKLDKIIIFSEVGAGVVYKEIYHFTYNSIGKVSTVQIENGDEFRYAYVNDFVTAVSRYVNGVKNELQVLQLCWWRNSIRICGRIYKIITQ